MGVSMCVREKQRDIRREFLAALIGMLRAL